MNLIIKFIILVVIFVVSMFLFEYLLKGFDSINAEVVSAILGGLLVGLSYPFISKYLKKGPSLDN